MLKGSSVTTLDKWGRVRIPAKFKRIIEEEYGKDIFTTSFDQKNILIYPLSEWENITVPIGEKAKENPTLRNFVIIINRLGMKTEMDKYGRILIHELLRNRVNLKGEIVIEGKENHLVLKKT